MQPILTLVALIATISINLNLVTAQAAQERTYRFQDRNYNGPGSNVRLSGSGRANSQLPPIVDASEASEATSSRIAPSEIRVQKDLGASILNSSPLNRQYLTERERRLKERESSQIKSQGQATSRRDHPANRKSSVYKAPASKNRGLYQTYQPGHAAQQSQRQDKVRHYVPIPKNVIPLEQPLVQRQRINSQYRAQNNRAQDNRAQDNRAQGNLRFAPRPTAGSFTFQRDHYRRKGEVPPIVQQDVEEPRRRVIQLRSNPTKSVAETVRKREPADVEPAAPIEPAPFIEEPAELSQTQEPIVEPFPQERKAPSVPVDNSIDDNWFTPPEVESKLVETPELPPAPSEIEVVEEKNQWVEPEFQTEEAELPQQEFVEAPPEPAFVEAPSAPAFEAPPQQEVVEASPFKAPASVEAPPEQEVVEASPFKAPSSFGSAQPPTDAVEMVEAAEVPEEPAFSPFQATVKAPETIEPELPVAPEAKVQQNVVANEFTPKKKVKRKFEELFSSPLPMQESASKRDPFVAKEKPPIILKSQSPPPVRTVETPKVSNPVAANYMEKEAKPASLWWLYLLPLIPLLLIGWYLLRGMFADKESPNQSVYQHPTQLKEPVNEPVSRQYSEGIESLESMEIDIPAARSNTAVIGPVENEIETTDAQFFPIASETETALPATTASHELKILHEEEIEVLDDFEDSADFSDFEDSAEFEGFADFEDLEDVEGVGDIGASDVDRFESVENFDLDEPIYELNKECCSSQLQESCCLSDSETEPEKQEPEKQCEVSEFDQSLNVKTDSETSGSESFSDSGKLIPLMPVVTPPVARDKPSVNEVKNSGPKTSATTKMTAVQAKPDVQASAECSDAESCSHETKPTETCSVVQTSAGSNQKFVDEESEELKLAPVDSTSCDVKGKGSSDLRSADQKPGSSKSSSATTGQYSGKKKLDDLTRIRGIDADVASRLRNGGIDTFTKLSNAGPALLKQILKSGGSKFQFINPVQWPAQAELAAKGDWKGLKRWQTYHRELPSFKPNQNSSASADEIRRNTSVVESTTTRDLGRQATSTKQSVRPKSQPTTAKKPVAKTSKSSTSGKDDLTSISGVGAATQRYLNKKGIFSFAQVAAMKDDQLKEIFVDGGNRFQLLNTETWAQQAKEILESMGQQTQSAKKSQPSSQGTPSITNIVNLDNGGLNSTGQPFTS